MKKLIAILSVLLCLSSNAFAQAYEANVLERLASYAETNQPDRSGKYITSRLHELFDRLLAHDSIALLPSGMKALSEQKKKSDAERLFKAPCAKEVK